MIHKITSGQVKRFALTAISHIGGTDIIDDEVLGPALEAEADETGGHIERLLEDLSPAETEGLTACLPMVEDVDIVAGYRVLEGQDDWRLQLLGKQKPDLGAVKRQVDLRNATLTYYNWY